MTQLFIDGKPAVMKQQQIKLTLENEYFSGTGSYSFNIDLPAHDPRNIAIYGHINRIDGTTPESKPAVLRCDNIDILIGTAVVTNITNDTIKVQLLGGTSVMNSKIKEEEKYIDELPLGDWYNETFGQYPGIESKEYTGATNIMIQAGGIATLAYDLYGHADFINYMFMGNKWVAYPIHNSNCDTTCNDYVFRESIEGNRTFRIELPYSTPDGQHNGVPQFKFAVQPFVWFMAQKIAKATGYTLSTADNALYTNEFFRLIFIASANIHIECNKCLSHWTVSEWWDNIENMFGVVVTTDEATKQMRITKRGDYYKKSNQHYYITEVLDEFSIDCEDDDIKDISTSNVGYAGDLSPFDRIDEEILSAATIDESFNNLEALRAWIVNNEEFTELDSWATDKLWKCKDGRFYMYRKKSDNPTSSRDYSNRICEVNQLRNRIVRGDSNDLDIELKFVPCRYVEHTTKVCEKKNEFKDHVLTEVPSEILQRPDLNDFSWQQSDSELDTSAKINLEDVINGEEEIVSVTPEDVIYIAIASRDYRDKLILTDDLVDKAQTEEALEWVRPFLRESSDIRESVMIDPDYTRKHDSPYSLSLVSISDQINMASETTAGEMKVDTLTKYCIKFISKTIPSPNGVFYFRNKKFLCEKLEVNITETGFDKMITGYFFRAD